MKGLCHAATVVLAVSVLPACADDQCDSVMGRPSLLGTSAAPHLGDVVVFRHDGAPQYAPVDFSADFVSDDGGQDVQSVLLVDHGDTTGVSNGPYSSYVPGPVTPAAACLSDASRRVTIPWQPREGDQGCHTVALLVTHSYAQTVGAYYCPADAADASILTWSVFVCANDDVSACVGDPAFSECATPDTTELVYCPGM